MDLSEVIVPVAGITRTDTARSIAGAAGIVFDDEDRARLDERFGAGRALRARGSAVPEPARDSREGDVVLIMGLPGAGKSTLAESFVARGYARLNRDTAGGSLADLLPGLDPLIASGTSHIVLDNTYVSRESRARVIAAAGTRGLPVRCLSLETGLEDAQVNAVQRMLKSSDGFRAPRNPPRVQARCDGIRPAVQFRYQRELEPPHPSEDSRQSRSWFERRRNPAFVNKALVCGSTACCAAATPARARRVGRDVDVLPGRGEVLQRYEAEGWRLLGLSWQPEIADETMILPRRRGGVHAARSFWECRSSSRSVHTPQVRRSAGAGNHCPASGRPHRALPTQSGGIIYVGGGRRIGFARRLVVVSTGRRFLRHVIGSEAR